MTRCLEDQGNVYGIVRDLGIICSLTRCRPGWLLHAVATNVDGSILAILGPGARVLVERDDKREGWPRCSCTKRKKVITYRNRQISALAVIVPI